jgi:hypothetical protein
MSAVSKESVFQRRSVSFQAFERPHCAVQALVARIVVSDFVVARVNSVVKSAKKIKAVNFCTSTTCRECPNASSTKIKANATIQTGEQRV